MSAPSPLPVVRAVTDLRAAVSAWRAAGLRTAFVPTMGALHEGHLSLVRLGREKADRVAASVFVNPTQFAPTEDLDRYPRQEERDAELLASAGCDLLFAPSAAEMYPADFATSVTVSGLTEDLEGRFRPQMFGGVATVVAKLLIGAGADVAVFGEKDYQQLLVIRRMAKDLNLPVEIVPGPTVREPDGLAMSSRNAYLGAAERAVAAQLNVILGEAAAKVRAGEAVEKAEAAATAAVLLAGFERVDYVAVRSAEDLGPYRPGQPARALAAAWLGQTRLIDNLPV